MQMFKSQFHYTAQHCIIVNLLALPVLWIALLYIVRYFGISLIQKLQKTVSAEYIFYMLILLIKYMV